MSHVADCDFVIADVDACAEAARALGGELVRDQKTHAWYGRFLNDWDDGRAAVNRRDPASFGKCDHAIKFPGIRYEVGLCREIDGSYTPVYDQFGNHGEHDGQKLEQLLGGAGLPKLKNEYAAQVTTRMMQRKGFRVTRTTNDAGAIVLKVGR